MQTKENNLKGTMKIQIATTDQEKEKIFRLRYHIYAEEMSKRFPHMDHTNRVLCDDLDDWGVLVYAQCGSECIGTLRVNIGLLSDFPAFWVQALSLNRFQKFNPAQPFAYTSKFMVLDSYRNSTASHLLSAKGYEIYCEQQVQFNFGVSNFHLLRLYEQFGCRRYGRNFIDSGYGLLAPYVLLVDDVAHLRTVRSPFFRIARKRKILNHQVTEWFFKEFSECSGIINSQLIGEEELWQFLCSRFLRLPNQAIPLLQQLSDGETKKFLHCCSVIVQCHAGEQIICKGDQSYSLHILISGQLVSSASLGPNASSISPGQHFGANGLLNHPCHHEDIFAVTDTEIIVLSSLAFPKFRHSHPEITDKILRTTLESPDHSLSISI